MKTAPAILLTLALAVPTTWFVARSFHNSDSKNTASQPPSQDQRKLLYYQSAMHPWIKSDKPGRCTICGMELTPVYEGDPGFDSDGDVVQLNQSMIQVLNVQTAPAQIRPLKKSLTVSGIIDDDDTRHRILSAYIPGRIEKLHVNFLGAEVQAGQPLADFYSPALLQAEREYRSLTGDLRAATALRLRQMGLTHEQIEALSSKPQDQLTSQILAPVSGTVVAKNVYAGQYVQEGDPLLEIADFSTMWFQFRAYEQDLPWIQTGLKVDITSRAHPGYTYTGTITFIDPTLDDATRSARVRVELENPPAESGHRMMHKLYADAVVHLDAPQVLTIPRAAVIETGADPVAYVDQGEGSFARRPLKLGRRGDAHVEVTSGLDPGDKVVVNGNLLLDGQAEMNRVFAQPSPHDSPAVSPLSSPLTDAEKQAADRFIQVVDAISAALANNDLAQFNVAGPKAMDATSTFVEALKNRAELADILKHLAESRHLHDAPDLPAARKMFHPFSNAAAHVLESLGAAPNPPAFDAFECPMVDRAIPGVPKKGRWIQAAGRKIANPYFGPEMLDCGKKLSR